MNKTFSMGRLTDEPKIFETSTGKKFARFTMALDRMKEGADYPSFIAWEQKADFAEKMHKGMRFLVEGHIQTGSYDKDGQKVYTTDIVVERIEFADAKKDGTEEQPTENPNDGFMNIPEGVEDEMPFN